MDTVVATEASCATTCVSFPLPWSLPAQAWLHQYRAFVRWFSPSVDAVPGSEECFLPRHSDRDLAHFFLHTGTRPHPSHGLSPSPAYRPCPNPHRNVFSTSSPWISPCGPTLSAMILFFAVRLFS